MSCMDYPTWLSRVEQKLMALSEGTLGFGDIPQEVHYHPMWNDGITPTAAARETLEVAGFYSFSF